MTTPVTEDRVPRPKPFIAVAVFCEHVLREHDGVSSLIRIVDTFTVPNIPTDLTAKATVQLTGFLVFKSGEAKGKYEVRLVLHPSTGTPVNLGDPQHIVLNGGEHGAAVVLKLELEAKQVGLSWIDVIVDGEVLTRMPFRLRREGEESEEARRSTSS